MKTRTLLLAVCALVALPGASARAAEREFECPRISPIDGQTPLAFVNVLHSGTATWGRTEPNEVRRSGGIVRRRTDWTPERFFNAKTNCEYGWNRRPPFHTVTIDMPGQLLRCEGEYPDPPPSRDRLHGRFWCTTDVDARR